MTTALISGGSAGVVINGGAGTVTNFGTITSTSTSSGNGVSLHNGGSISNGSSISTAALISSAAGHTDIYVNGGAGSLTNFASLKGGTLGFFLVTAGASPTARAARPPGLLSAPPAVPSALPGPPGP